MASWTMADFEDVLIETLGEIDFDPHDLKQKYLAERDKRLRTDGNDQYIEVTGDFSDYRRRPVRRSRSTASRCSTTSTSSIVGGGFGGLLMGGRLREAGFDDIRVIEKGGDFGGTWYWNRYPGAMCDVESYCYLPMLEELGYLPKHKYSFAPEIMEHSKNIARHYRLYDNALLSTAVTARRVGRRSRPLDHRHRSRRPDDRPRRSPWPTARSTGPSCPASKASTTIRVTRSTPAGGTTTTRAAATKATSIGLSDKRVGIIGTGATAVQCVPHLGASAKELYVFQRTPSSVDVRNNRETPPDFVDGLEPGWQYRRMENFNKLVTGADQDEDLVNDGWTDIFRNLTGIAAKTASKKLGRRLTPAERAELMEMADYRKMESVRRRARGDRRRPERWPNRSSPGIASSASGPASTTSTCPRSTGRTCTSSTPTARASTASPRPGWSPTASTTNSTASSSPPASRSAPPTPAGRATTSSVETAKCSATSGRTGCARCTACRPRGSRTRSSWASPRVR